MSVLEVRNVSKRFGSLVAVRDVSLTVAKGELRAIIGPNGAGKTTFFNLISGFFRRPSGTIAFDGRDITAMPAHQRVTLGMARTFQITEIFPELTVFENVRIGTEVAAGLSPAPVDQRRRNERGPSAGRGDAQARRAGRPRPTGWSANSRTATSARPRSRWRWRCGRTCCCSTSRPPAWATQETYEITQLIRRLHRDSNFTIVLIEHDMRVVFHLADRITVLDQGRLLAEGTPRKSPPTKPFRPPIWARPHDAPALTAEGLHTYYGKSHILHGRRPARSPKARSPRCSAATAPARQRRCAASWGSHRRAPGRITIFGTETTHWPTVSHRRRRGRLRARRPPHLRQISASTRT